ncbi:anaerobic ribonucleoside-triphosphate reductase activating protein [Candidatus Woesearchaeota archaeon]|nr:anaerobic ribonucleoside-triphosphate reductase activating protein [Candidatus Woesearchaeota archaeon]
MDINIKGVQKTSLLDYPGKVCATVFLSRCNFRCPYCHNAELVFDEIKEDIPPEEILDFLEGKKNWIDGICVTGGEPTLHKGLVDFARKVKEKGFLVKIDTNGTNPEMIQQLLDGKLADYIAMDIKAPLDKYEEVVRAKVNADAIQRTINLLMDSGIDYEFRTTVVPGLFEENDAEKIGEWLKGAKKFCIQQFRNSDKVLDPKYQNIAHYHIDKLEKFKTILKKYIKDVEIRGV